MRGRWWYAGAFVAAMVVVGVGLRAQSASPARFNPQGELLLPEHYREWVMVGTQVTPDELNGGKAPFTQIRTVYVDPASFATWKKTGQFQEGTILVKELLSVGAKQAPGSGTGYFMGEPIGLEASVKDSKRFPTEPGNWGFYVFYLPGQPVPRAVTNLPTADCASCHRASARDDLVFTQFYPTLRIAKGTGVTGVGAAR